MQGNSDYIGGVEAVSFLFFLFCFWTMEVKKYLVSPELEVLN